MNENEHYIMAQRRKVHDAITEVLQLDPDYARISAFVKGWVLVLDLSGLTPEDDDSVVDEVRGQPLADIDVWSSDATGEVDLPNHNAEGLLHYCALHYDDIYDSRPVNEEGDDDEDDDDDGD